ncbi:MAG: HEAT repeat domain-containing protein [Halobacteriota archaeon]
MGEYDFDRLTRYRRVDVLSKALNDENEHQRFKAVDALEAVALASGDADLSARDVLVQAATQSAHEDVKLHAKIALKTLNTSQEGRIQKTNDNRENGPQHPESKKNTTQKPQREYYQQAEDRLLCELDDDCTTLMVRGSALSPRHGLRAIKGGQWDKQVKVWRFPINRASIESLKNGGVVLHPTVQCLCTSSHNTWAVGTRNKKWIKVLGDTHEIEGNLKQVPGSQWDSSENAWRIPFKADSIKRLIRIDRLYVSPFILD